MTTPLPNPSERVAVLRPAITCLPATSTQGVTVYATGLYEGDPFLSLMVKMPNGDTFLLGVNGLVRFVEETPGQWTIEDSYELPWATKDTP